MNAIVEILGALLSGNPIMRGRILPSCTAEAFGAEAFGEHAIRELFARNPTPLSSAPHLVIAERHVAVFDADGNGREQALFADIYDGRIGRLWRLGEGGADKAAERRLRIAVDPFLQQHREAVAFAAEDFPHLDPGAIAAVANELEKSVSSPLGADENADRRMIALRAFSSGPLTAVLGQILCPRTAPILTAAGLRLVAGACVRSWRVSDMPRETLVCDDLMLDRVMGKEFKGHS